MQLTVNIIKNGVVKRWGGAQVKILNIPTSEKFHLLSPNKMKILQEQVRQQCFYYRRPTKMVGKFGKGSFHDKDDSDLLVKVCDGSIFRMCHIVSMFFGSLLSFTMDV